MSDSRLSIARPPGQGGRASGLINWFAENPVAANLLMAFFLIGGFIQASGLSAQLFPTIDPGIVTVCGKLNEVGEAGGAGEVEGFSLGGRAPASQSTC